jgi:hypothetical protein
MNCRLLVNIIVGGKSYPRDSVVDDSLIPDRLKKHVVYETENRDGNIVLLLRDLHFQSSPRPMSDGVMTSFPVFVGKGESCDLSQIPEGKRRELVAGVDYKVDWTFDDQDELRRSSEKEYLDQFQNEPEPAFQAPWRQR